jgi:uncharacterized repeat protein (TIGR01451 family)
LYVYQLISIAMKTTERERHDWMIILIILVIGFLGVLVAGQWALRFSPRWQLDANMESNLDPNSDFLTSRPNGFIEPVDPSILTQPAWADFFLTPGASFATKTPFTLTSTDTTMASPTLPATPTTALQVTSTAEFTAVPTSTFVPLPWVPTPTSKPPHTNPATDTSTPTSTAVSTPTNTPTTTPTPTDTPPPIADLQIIKYDGASTYVANGTLTYSLTITNAGPSGIVDAVVTDNIPVQVANWSWVCTSQTGGATGCDGMTGSANFSDTVQLPNGASIVYTATASISGGASGDLTNVASINLPTGFTDPAPGNNSAADTNQILIANPFPWGNIGTGKDTLTTSVPSGSSITLALASPLIVGGHPGYDLVYYEMPAGSGILMDQVILQVSDGYNWYTILNWGDNSADAHTNISISSIGGAEDDNRDIASGLLHDTTGVAIDLDALPIPSVTYSYIRITAPAGDSGDGCDIDAIVILP